MTDKYEISQKDKDFWLEFTKDIKPLEKKHKKSVQRKEPKIIISQGTVKKIKSTSGKAQIDNKKAREIKRKGLKTQARIDLHGLTQDRAYNRLYNFIERNWLNGVRNLLIITGKGKDYEGSGILKQMLPRWLSETRFDKMILHITTAKQRDGGDGAFYVILRKRR